VADGDSITQDGGSPYSSQLSLSPLNWRVSNVAQSGETIATMLSLAPTRVDPLYNSGALDNVVVIWGGTNDLENGATVAATYANLAAYVAARHAKGWKVVVVTMISRVNLDTQKDAYNALIVANTAGADAIASLISTPLGCDGCYSNTTWFGDQIHPTAAGISTYEVPAISAVIP
jgi:lysophospholipase L1-like esterase